MGYTTGHSIVLCHPDFQNNLEEPSLLWPNNLIYLFIYLFIYLNIFIQGSAQSYTILYIYISIHYIYRIQLKHWMCSQSYLKVTKTIALSNTVYSGKAFQVTGPLYEGFSNTARGAWGTMTRFDEVDALVPLTAI